MRGTQVGGELVLIGTVHAAWDESVFALKYSIFEGRRVLLVIIRPEEM